MLLGNDDYILSPIEVTWLKQHDKQHQNKKIRESSPMGKGMHCAKIKAN